MAIRSEGKSFRPSPATRSALLMSGVHQPSPAVLRIVPLQASRGLQVSGEIDRTTRKPWEEALNGLVVAGRDMHLELSDLTFIDVRGTCLLAEAAHSLPTGRKVVLHHPPYCLRSVLALIGSLPSPIEVET